jgi:hypothetical protein
MSIEPVHARRTLILAWLVTGLCAVGGSMLGNALGRSGLFAGATLGGIVGVAVSVLVAVRLAWLPRAARGGAMIGGLVGFALAVPIAVLTGDTPVTPIASCALVGVGVLFGAGFARRS